MSVRNVIRIRIALDLMQCDVSMRPMCKQKLRVMHHLFYASDILLYSIEKARVKLAFTR